MEKKTITSVTLILVGNMLTTYNNIGSGWTATVTAIIGFVMFFIGLGQLKSGEYCFIYASTAPNRYSNDKVFDFGIPKEK